MVSKEDIYQIAEFCKVKFNEDEVEDFSQEFSEILKFIDIIKEVDTEGVEPTYFINTDRNPLREDEVGKSLPIEEVLKNAPEEKYGYFKLPNVMD